MPRASIAFEDVVGSPPADWEIATSGPGPQGRLPLTAEMLLERPSGDLFGLTQNAGMGWDPRELGRPQFLVLGTQGGIRAPDGRPVALGYHTGHWEIGLLMHAAATELDRLECLPFAGFCSDPCDGRTQGTTGMMERRGPDRIGPGDVLILICRGPLGAGMEEIYQITSALKHLDWGKHVAVLTDARFSGVSTGACIGHIGPEALAGGPIGRVRDGDLIRIVVDRNRLEGRVDMVGEAGRDVGAEEGERLLAARAPREDLAPDPDLPADTRLWAALQHASGGTWGGCVYDADAVAAALARAR